MASGSDGPRARRGSVPTGGDRPEFPKRIDLALGSDWRVHVNFDSGKLVLSRANRPDLAHLTIFWGTASGELDIHLTHEHERAMVDREPKVHDPIAIFTKAELETAGLRAQETIVNPRTIAFLKAKYRKWRPGWLAANGYILTVSNREQVISWGKSVLPKKRGKYRFDREKLDPSHVAGELVVQCDPRALHCGAELQGTTGGPTFPVQAIRVVRGRIVAEDAISLNYTRGPDGTTAWWGAKHGDLHAFARQLGAVVFDRAIPLVRPEHADKFETIVRGMGLEELEDLRDGVTMVRAFLRNPRNPIREPYPGGGRT